MSNTLMSLSASLAWGSIPTSSPGGAEHPGTPMSELSSDGMGALIALGRGKASGQSAAR
jgi:hypothetical protein